MGLTVEAQKMIDTLKEYRSPEDIAKILYYDEQTVISYLDKCNKDKEKPTTSRKIITAKRVQKRISGRPMITSKQQDEIMKEMLYSNAACTATEIQRALKQVAQDTPIFSLRTIQRRMSQLKSNRIQRRSYSTGSTSGNSSSVESTTSKMSPIQKRLRLQWAIAHQDWTVPDWRNIFNLHDDKYFGEVLTAKKDVFVDTLTGPVKSPDLNIMEQLMRIVGSKVGQYEPQTVQQFKTVLFDLLYTDEEIAHKVEILYVSMPQRIDAVIQNFGGETEFCDIE